jgi:hypothetical protein
MMMHLQAKKAGNPRADALTSKKEHVRGGTSVGSHTTSRRGQGQQRCELYCLQLAVCYTKTRSGVLQLVVYFQLVVSLANGVLYYSFQLVACFLPKVPALTLALLISDCTVSS